jgi:1-acyl-sn-glycerol-3-phosphate acyltransferase
MQPAQSLPPKPVSEIWHPELTRLPSLKLGQRFFRRWMRALVRLIVFVFIRARLQGLEKFPRTGPALVVTNHLGDADGVLGVAFWPVFTDSFAKIELFELPILGWIFEKYGVIWVHRGQPDRRAISAALEGLNLGRIISIAPEGRESPIGALEGGTEGAAFLARKAGVPIVPVAITGTENGRIYGNMKRFRRTDVTMTVGDPFLLPDDMDRKIALETGTRLIMEALARLLPEKYRGVYKYVGKDSNQTLMN